MKSKILGLLAVGLLAGPMAALAGPIVCATSATVDVGGSTLTSITNTYNQVGLSTGYTCGVTDFDSYIASGPSHTLGFTSEWFSFSGVTAAVVTYDLGSVDLIDGLALWNEETAGIGLLNLLGSVNGNDFFTLASGIQPFDNPLADYLPEVFGFGSTALRYVRFDMSNCPQVNPGTFRGCAIGEVAFRQGAATVPEPGTLALLGLGLAGLGLSRRRKAN